MDSSRAALDARLAERSNPSVFATKAPALLSASAVSVVRREQPNSRRPNLLRRALGIGIRKYGTRESRRTRTCAFCDSCHSRSSDCNRIAMAAALWSPPRATRDGHPARGGFLPPVPLSNRMWAGGKLEFHGELPLGAKVEKRSSIASVEHKQGRSGELVFVTVVHEIVHEGKVLVMEHDDIVYKEASKPGATAATLDMPKPQRTLRITPDPTMLFRYSALTFNGDRIHYDTDYCREVEGYPNLVIHGPLNATLLAGLAEDTSGRRLRHFRYRGVRPSILGNELEFNAAQDGDQLVVWVSSPGGAVSMRAYASGVLLVFGLLVRMGVPETKDFVEANRSADRTKSPIREAITTEWKAILLSALVRPGEQAAFYMHVPGQTPTRN